MVSSCGGGGNMMGGGNMTGGEYVFECLDNLLRISVFFSSYCLPFSFISRKAFYTELV